MYFSKFDNEKGTSLRYIPFMREIIKIRKYLDKIGILDASDVELYEAWSMFSKEQYDKNFLLPESIYLNDFADWLNDREEI